MYLHKLEKDEKTAFLTFARQLAQMDDGRIDDKEAFMLRYMATEMGLALDTEKETGAGEPISREQLLKVFYRPEARRVLLLEGVGIALANGEFGPAQRQTLETLAVNFQLGSSFIDRIESLVRLQLAVMDEFDRIVKP